MNLIKAIFLGIILWVLIFLEVSVLMFGFKLNYPNNIYSSMHFLFLSLFTIAISVIYFRYPKKIKTGFVEGLLFGLVLFVVAIILDSIITIPLFMKNDYNFLLRTDILIGEIWGVILASVVGWINSSEEHKKKVVKRR
ncbi:MAG: hypothetical protein WC867_00285 [Candidatus Pacearchaeota archaeon]|jgi:xanthine/uracil permease